jgi:hypothetical protein
MEIKRLHAAVRAIKAAALVPPRFSPFGGFLAERGDQERGFPKGEN